ncbi:MAG: hypothetical protein ACYSVY_01125, partial [Planctomycetota bacterium]
SSSELGPFHVFDPGGQEIGFADLFAFDLGDFTLLDKVIFMVDGVDLFLNGLQEVLDGEVFGMPLPLVGKKLSAGAGFIEDFRGGFLTDFRTEIEEAASPDENFISELLTDLLGPGGLDILLSDITLTTDSDSFMEWEMTLGGTPVNAGADIGFDIGIPGLGLKTEGDIEMTLDWEMDFGFGLSLEEGFYFILNAPDNQGNAGEPELRVDAKVTLPGGGITGTLGFLQLTARNKDVDDKPKDDDTHLGAKFAVDINNKKDTSITRNGNDKYILPFSEFGSIDFDFGVAAEAEAELGLSLGVAGNNGKFPKIFSDFFLHWEIGDYASDSWEIGDDKSAPVVPLSEIGDAIQDGLQKVEFQDVSLDLGSYLEQVLEPVVRKVQETVGPVQPIIDIATTPLPVLADLGIELTLLDLAAYYGNVDPSMIAAIERIAGIISTLNNIDLPEEGGLVIPIGTFPIFDVTDVDLHGVGFELGSPDFDLDDLDALANRLLADGGPLSDILSGLPDSVAGAIDAVAGEAISLVKDLLDDNATQQKDKFDLPILSNPSSAFGLLLGKPVPLVTYDLAPLVFEFEWTKFISILGPLGASINVEFGASADFAFGYDTQGIEDLADSGFRNWALLLNGLYVSDTENPDGSGEDVPEVELTGGLWAAAELNLAVARGGVGGGIFAYVDMNLNDPDSDGRVRLEELASNFLNQTKAPETAERFLAPLAVFDVSGEITAEFFAFLKVDLFLFKIDKKWHITDPITLLDFEIDFFRPPTLATELENGDLVLNMGEFAESRLRGNTEDIGEIFHVEDAGPGKVRVWADNLGEDATVKQEYSVTGKIIALAGEGDDELYLDGANAYEIEGGAGDDWIEVTGNGDANIRGGSGEDEITGGSGDDVIYGEQGRDIIHAGGGHDLVFGDSGEISDDHVLAEVNLTDAADEIYGEGGHDILFGAGGEDVLDGGAGRDVLVGDGGLVRFPQSDPKFGNYASGVEDTNKGAGFADTLIGGADGDRMHGGPGGDIMDGGAGDDYLYGEAGIDTMYGGSDSDHLYGGTQGDTMFGLREPGAAPDGDTGADGVDFMYGDEGGDLIHGDGGDDEIYGGPGPDVLWGDADNDSLFGQGEPDRLYGGDHNDVLDGGAGDDIVFGDNGPADYVETDLVTDVNNALASADLGDKIRATSDGNFIILTAVDSAVTGFNILAANRPAWKELGFGNTSVSAIDEGFGLTVKGELTPSRSASEVSLDEAETYADMIRQGQLTGDAVFDVTITYAGGTSSTIAVTVSGTDTNERVGSSLRYSGPGGVDELYAGLGSDTLDGQGGSDSYFIDLLGADNGSLIDVIESGAVGADQMTVNGTDFDDLFLMRAYRVNYDDTLAFVALMNQNDRVERVNYRRSMEELRINGRVGNDWFAIDDNRGMTTIDGGIGDDRFQVGQLYRSPRNEAANVALEDIFATIPVTRGFLSNGISEAMTIYGGPGEDEFVVFHNLAVLSLFGQEGDDSFRIRAFALVGSTDTPRARTDLSGGGGADFIQYAVNAPVNIDGGDGFDTVIVTGTEFPDDFVVTEDGIFGAGLNINFVNVESVQVDGAEGDDRVFLLSTSEKVFTQITGGLGSDTFYVAGPTPPVVSDDKLGHSGVIEHSVTSADPGYDNLKVIGISANVGDNEAPGIVITPAEEDLVVTEGGPSVSYTIVLTREPLEDVIITVGAPEPTEEEEAQGFDTIEFEGTVESGDPLNPTPEPFVTQDGKSYVLKFTPEDWFIPQTVSFHGVDDSASEGVRTGYINHSVASEEALSDRFDASKDLWTDTTLLLRDESFPYDLTGATLKLIGPDGVTQVRTVLSNSTETINGEAYEKFELSGNKWILDPADESDIVITLYDGLAIRSLLVQINDNDRAGVIVNQTDHSTHVIEGGATDHYELSLARPLDNTTDVVYVELGLDGQTSITIDGMAFDPANLGISGTVDTGTTSSTTLGSASFPGADGLSGYFVKIIDGTGAGQVREIVSNTASVLTVDEAWAVTPDGTSTYGIVAAVKFTAGDYSDIRLVTVEATDDAVEEGFHKGYITHIVTSTDVDDTVTVSENDLNFTIEEEKPQTSIRLPNRPRVEAEGVATSGTGTTLVDDSANFSNLAGHFVTITGGTGAGQMREVGSASGTTITLKSGSSWETVPDDTSKYRILAPITVKVADSSVTDPGTVTAREAERFVVISSTLLFLDEDGNPEPLSGNVWVGYEYTEPGYDGVNADRVVADVADNDAPGVIIRESKGSTDVIESPVVLRQVIQRSQTQTDNVFSPNILTFDFDVSALAPTGDGVLTVSVIADIDHSSEYLALDAEGVALGNLFDTAISGGTPTRTEAQTTVTLTQAQLASWAADGIISFEVTPSLAVGDFGSNELTLELSFPAVPTDGGGFLNDQSLTQENNVFFPNVLPFDFAANGLVPTGEGVLTVSVIADIDHFSEYLALNAEGVALGNLFDTAISGGTPTRTEAQTTVTLTQAQLASWAADGIISFEVSPSAAVDDFGSNELTLQLEFPAVLSDDAGFPGEDTYSVVLTKAPQAGTTVEVTVNPVKTVTSLQYDPAFVQVEVFSDHPDARDNGDGTITLVFDETNWDVPQEVTVTARDDALVDGQQTKVFAPMLHTLTEIKGPVFMAGAAGEGSLAGLGNPLLLPGELNVQVPTGNVIDFNPDGTELTVATANLAEPLVKHEGELVDKTVEVTEGPGIDQFRLIKALNHLGPVHQGTATGGGTANTLQDTTVDFLTDVGDLTGYLVRIASGTGTGQVREIESQSGGTLTVTEDFSQTPDTTSVYEILVPAVFHEGAVGSATGTNLTDPDARFPVDTQSDPESGLLTGKYVRIVSGVGAGQVREITDNTGTELTIGAAWTVDPDSTSTYEVFEPSGITVLTLNAPFDIDTQEGETFDQITKYAITAESLNFFADERDQVDYMRVFSTDSVADEQGVLTENRIYGLGMGPDALIGGRLIDGGITFEELETLILDLGVGDDTPRVEGTHGRFDYNTVTMVNTGPGDDTVHVSLQEEILVAPTTVTLTASGGSATTLEDSDATFIPDDFTGDYIRIVLGPGIGQVRKIASNTTTEITVSSAWDPAHPNGVPTTNSVYEIFRPADGFFALRTETGDDYVYASGIGNGEFPADMVDSTLPLVVFGGEGNDEIYGGLGDDILFGDHGRVDYLNEIGAVVTRVGEAPQATGDGLIPVQLEASGAIVAYVDGFSDTDTRYRLEEVLSGTVSSSGPGNNTLVDDSADFPVGKRDLGGYIVRMTSGANNGEFRFITANTESELTLDRDWDNPLSSGDTYTTNVQWTVREEFNGTVQGVGTTDDTLTIDETGRATDELAGLVIEITGGAGAGQFRIIKGNDSSGVITVDRAWDGGAPDHTSSYSVHKQILVPDRVNFPTTEEGLKGLYVWINEGEGFGQSRLIVDNTANELILDRAWDVQTNSTSRFRISTYPEDQTDGVFRDPSLLLTVYDSMGGMDTIYGNEGDDRIFGGFGGDTIHGNRGGDALFGDNGRMDFIPDFPTSPQLPARGDRVAVHAVLDFVQTTHHGSGGIDNITGDEGTDLIFGGAAGDILEGNHGSDVIVGDNGEVDLAGEVTGNLYVLGSAIRRIQTTDITDSTGGADTIHGNRGDDVIIGGVNDSNEELRGNDGDDILLGDNGIIHFDWMDDTSGDGDVTTLDLIRSFTDGLGGRDTLSGNGGSDVIIGSSGGDDVYGDDEFATAATADGEDILIGDNADITFTDEKIDGYHILGTAVARVETTDDQQATGGADSIYGHWDEDILIGGVNGNDEELRGNDGDDILLGDNGYIVWDADGNVNDIDEITSILPSLGGIDFVYGGPGDDLVIGGTAGDTIDAGDGDNVVVGDSGQVTGAVADSPRHLGPSLTALTLGRVETISPDIGGSDTIDTGLGNDIALGGIDGDTINAGEGDNIVLGDNGLVDWESNDSDPSDIDIILTRNPNSGGSDGITTGGGADVVLGGTADDTVHSGDGRDLVFGDHGEVSSLAFTAGDMGNRVVPFPSDVPVFYDYYYFRAVDTQTSDGGASDHLYGQGSGDIVLGQQGDDVIFGGSGDDDIYGGHNVAGGHDGVDTIDGGTENDVVAGDNASIQRRGDSISPRMRVLSGTLIYDPQDNALVTPDSQADPTGRHVRDVVLFDSSHTPANGTFGSDTIAGGADDDVIFGQLGDDTLHGDGMLDGSLDLMNLTQAPAGSDPGGDDYIEGNGGTDTIYGGLGQDDIIGGNSTLFGLDLYDERPDGSDTIFGGNGDMVLRNNLGDLSAEGHARDADTILGDNGNIFRLVGTSGVPSGGFLTFNYDDYSGLRIIPRATELLDYTPGGPDLNPDLNPHPSSNDIGDSDEIHGESGDDSMYGMKGSDIMFGEGQDDDIIGGYGNDWISGGTGEDGVIGDDGRIYASRNTPPTDKFDTSLSEPLYGIGKVAEETIATPGGIQEAVINVAGELVKNANLTPFMLGDSSRPQYMDNEDPQHADDVIYGGWGDDFLHGGDGDDAISGAEALSEFYGAPENAGNVLGYGEIRAGEFAAYNEYNPWAKVYVDEYGVFVTDGTGSEFLLNFDPTEGPSAGVYDTLEAFTDGDDAIFGDLGHDWLVGGTGEDLIFGGRGDDLLNADDDHGTLGETNRAPDTHPSYEDFAYGGAGRDILIANTGGDRLTDWAGEFNSYIVPYAPFGAFTIFRAPQPHLFQFLYDLTRPIADQTRAADEGVMADAERNGEPYGELGLVTQRDQDWQDQTGAPADPQPGNIPGGARDVLRSATFNSGSMAMEAFAVDSGAWEIRDNSLRVSAGSLGGDAVSVFHVDQMLPSYFEIVATIATDKPTAGWKANAYIIFDYYGPDDFKFAGVDVSRDKMQMGHRTAEGWVVDVETPVQVKPNTFYNMMVAVHGTTATLLVDGVEFFTHTFDARVIDGWSYGLNTGYIGFGSDNSRGIYDNIIVQKLPPEITFEDTDDFTNTTDAADLFDGPTVGDWTFVDNRYEGSPAVGDDIALSLVNIGLTSGLETNSILEMEATLNTQGIGGIVFDYYGPEDFKFASIDVAANRLVIGHHTARDGWVIDAETSVTMEAGTDYTVFLSLKGTTVDLKVRQADSTSQGYLGVLGHVFNAVTVDGDFGLLSKDGQSSFDAVTVRTDDPAFRTEGEALTAADAAHGLVTEADLTAGQLDVIVQAAIARLDSALDLTDETVQMLGDVNFEVADLYGLTLGYTEGGTVFIDDDAAGHGWFIDATPYDDVEFRRRNGDSALLATLANTAYGDMDLLTVVMHEMGHLLGMEHTDQGLMDDSLRAGT